MGIPKLLQIISWEIPELLQTIPEKNSGTFADNFKENPLTPGTFRRCRKNRYRSLRWYR